MDVSFYRRITIAVSTIYLALFLIALQDITFSGSGQGLVLGQLSQMFERSGVFVFEPVGIYGASLFTLLISPINILVGSVISVLVGLNLTITYIAYKHPKVCDFNRSTGVLSSLPALLAGGACCAPAIILILGIQASALMISLTQIMIPFSIVILLITLKLILDRTTLDYFES